jgi:hypothetical protein
MQLILALITILQFTSTIFVKAHFLRNNDVKNLEEHRKVWLHFEHTSSVCCFEI